MKERYKQRKELNIRMGERIRASREDARLTQEKLAELIDVSVQYISDLERGVVGASIPTMIKICESLHVSADYIMMGRRTDSEYSGIIQDTRYLPQDQREIIDKTVALLMDAMGKNKYVE